MDIRTPCNRRYMRTPIDGHRKLSSIDWIVLHSTEGGTAESVAHYFLHNSGGYTHLVVDDNDCYRCLENEDIPRGAPGANTFGFHIEQCGYAAWSNARWISHIKTIRRAAWKTAVHCHKLNVPPVFVVASDLKRGKKGITTHAECTKAFGGDHTDPGSGWPRLLFMGLVKMYYRELSA